MSARVEELLDALKAGGFGRRCRRPRRSWSALLVGLYGDGLGQIMTLLAEPSPAGAAMIAALADDPLVESLLLLHDLHPLDVDARIQRALDRVRPYLGSHAGGVEYLGVDDDGRRPAQAGRQLPRLPVLDGHGAAGDHGRGAGRRARGHRGRWSRA